MGRLQRSLRTLGLYAVCAALLTAGACDESSDSSRPSPGSDGRAPQSPVDPADAADVFARAAVVLASCIGTNEGANRKVSDLWDAELIPQFWGRFHLQAECLATAGGGCDAVTECLGLSLSEAPECVQGCNGNLSTGCVGEVALQLDCGAIGMTCHDGAGCIDGEATPCDRNASCSATRGDPRTCSDHFIRRGPNCEALGLRCDQGACRGTGARCVGLNFYLQRAYRVDYEGAACQGDLLQACVADSMHERDCTSIAPGFSCRMHEGVAFCGLADECVPGNLHSYDRSGTPVTCDGSMLTLCNAGRIETIDCRALGFDACDVETEGCLPNFGIDLVAESSQ